MSTVKFLVESTDAPHLATVKKETLKVPDPGMNEYRRYFNQRLEDVSQPDGNEGQTITQINRADYVAIVADHDITDDEFKSCLSESGYSNEQITSIFA